MSIQKTMSADLRERWLREMESRATYKHAPGSYDGIPTYRGQPVTDEWPDAVTMRRDLGEQDVSSDMTLEAWAKMADGQTLNEFARGLEP